MRRRTFRFVDCLQVLLTLVIASCTTVARGQFVLDADDAIAPATTSSGDGLLGSFLDYPNDDQIFSFDDPTLQQEPIASFDSIVNLLNFVDTLTGPDPLDRYVVGDDIEAAFPDLGINNPVIVGPGQFFQDTTLTRGGETFRATFSGFINISQPGLYTFILGHDDGARLILGGQQVINFPGNTNFRETQADVVFMDPGLYPVVVDMYENLFEANLVFSWIPPEGQRSVVPTEVLFSQVGGRFEVMDFESPMGKTVKNGQTLPVKFELFFGDMKVEGQQQLDDILQMGCIPPACPKILISDVTGIANDLGIVLDDELIDDNVGEGGDLGDCFRYGDSSWIFNLRIADAFVPGNTYSVEVKIGDCVLRPGNSLFQIRE